jgi:hypothetical protein
MDGYPPLGNDNHTGLQQDGNLYETLVFAREYSGWILKKQPENHRASWKQDDKPI